MMGIFNGNGAESSNSSVAYVTAGGKALFYSTRAFNASQGTLFEVEGSGTLLLDGGVFPRVTVRLLASSHLAPSFCFGIYRSTAPAIRK